MRILRNPAQTPPCVLALGTFDGVHRGHQALLMRGGELAAALGAPLAVCTFEPHPLRVIRPEATPPLLTALPEKAALMAGFGVDLLCVTSFTAARAAQTPEDYMEELKRVYRPLAVVCGYNFTFGRAGRGTGETLRQAGFETVVMPEVTLEGEAVSSSRVRHALRSGDIALASRLMGHAYTLTGVVADGKHIGRTMGFPTANVTVPRGKTLPAFGVYACYLEARGAVHPAVVNVGRHPTLPEGAVTVEAHALDANLSLYGQRARLTFLRFQRPERAFGSVDELRGQIARDAEECRAWFAALG